MRTPPGFPLEIKPAFDAIREDMEKLAWKMTLFQNAYLNQVNRDILFERTATVFLLFEDSLSTDITISIARLMDPPDHGKKKPNLTLEYLFELIRDHGNSPSLLVSVKARYAKLRTILSDIGELRNKVLAHRDRPTALTSALQLPLTAQNIIDVCDEFKGIINDIDAYFAESTTLFNYQLSFSNLDNLICHLRRGIQAMDEDNEREMQQWMPNAAESALTTITIPPDLESRLDDEARRRGTTPELLALDGLRRLFASPSHNNGDEVHGTLFDFLNGYVGTVAGLAEPFSEDCGRRFAEGLAEKHQRDRQ